MLLLYYKISFIPKLFISFSVSHDGVTGDSDICDNSMTCITLLLLFVTCMTIICNVILHSLSNIVATTSHKDQ